MGAPRMVVADVPGKGRMWYLVDDSFDFVPEAKEFLDWKAATKRSPETLEAYCWRLGWFFRFLWQRQVDVCRASPADLVDFVIWLCNPQALFAKRYAQMAQKARRKGQRR